MPAVRREMQLAAVAINAPFTPLQETTRAAPAKAREFARLGFGD